MAHLWVSDTASEWIPTPLLEDTIPLTALVRLHRTVDPPDTWAILSGEPRLRLNGLPVPLGLAVLEDRDEIRVPGLTTWFSTEMRACVEPFPPSDARGCCPRCKQGIDTGGPAVRCPLCGLWHHASEELPCWSYAPTCAACTQDTALDAGYRWTPEGPQPWRT